MLHTFIIYATGILAPLAGIIFFSRRLPDVRRARARKQALAATGVLAVVLGLSYAQIAPVHGWPWRNYWNAALRNIGPGLFCTVLAAGLPNDVRHRALEFEIAQNAKLKFVIIQSSKQSHKIEAPRITFASDGVSILDLPARSSYERLLTGQMSNFAYAKLDDAQWEKLWQIFQRSGVVTVSTAFTDSHMPTKGFTEASNDFEQCLGQLELIGQ